MPEDLEDYLYFTDRAQQARAQAESAVEPHIRKLHVEFARCYERAAAAAAPEDALSSVE